MPSEDATGGNAFGPYSSCPAPILAIARSDSAALISWPLFAQDFQLYSSGVIAPWTWALTGATYATNLTGMTAAVSAAPGARFFRLKR